jgi:fructokinase
MQKVVCYGEVLWDRLPSGKKPGGAPMNVALHLKKHGIESRLISSIGRDENGLELKSFLLSQGLSTRDVQEHPTLPTGIVDVHLDQSQQATYSIVKPVAWDEIVYQQAFTDLICDSDALVFGSLASRSPISYNTLITLLQDVRLAIFDMNLRPPHFEKAVIEQLIRRCDILKINEHELDYLEESFQLEAGDIENNLRKLSDLTGTNTICITLGDKGAVVLHDSAIYKHKGFSVEVADTVGAGDAFLAAFISGFLQGTPMTQILLEACATGALVASRAGANPGYNISEVREIGNF